MIQIDLAWAMTWYLLISVGGLLILWTWLDRIGYRQSVTQQLTHVRECSICTYLYTGSSEETLPQCPRCGSFNTVNREP